MIKWAPVAMVLGTAGCVHPDPVCVSPAHELPSVALEECDGTARDLSELNETRASWLFLYAGS